MMSNKDGTQPSQKVNWADDKGTELGPLPVNLASDTKSALPSTPSFTQYRDTKKEEIVSRPLPVDTTTVPTPTPEADKLSTVLATQNLSKDVNTLIDDLIHHDVQVELSSLQKDEKSPLYSAQTFEQLNLRPELLQGVYAMNFNRPSKIQAKALPILLANPPRNLIAQSQSGTGKTAAFALTMLSRIDLAVKSPQAICLSNTRELARQIGDVVTKMGQFMSISVDYAIKDFAVTNDPSTAHIIIGTTGSVWDWIKKRKINTKMVRVLVFDEADAMLNAQGMRDDSMRIKKMMEPYCQVVFFSATYPEEVQRFAKSVVPNADVITLRQEELYLDAIRQFYMPCRHKEHKIEVLMLLYGLMTIGQSMVFCETRDGAERVAARLLKDGYTVSLLHGQIEASQRDTVIDDFRKGITKVLISTNVLSRGIDILQVSLVINFDLPRLPLENGQGLSQEPDYETYLHRIGRTGRFGRNGVTINLIDDEKSEKILKKIEAYFNKPITMIPVDDIDHIEQKLKETGKC